MSAIFSDKIGVKVETIKSSPLKAAPNGFEPTSPEARAAIESMIKDSVRLVQRPGAGPPASRRRGNCRRVADGRVFTGHQAIELKLVDELGDEQDRASPGSRKEKNIDAKLPVRDYQLHSRFRDLPFLHATAVATARCGRPRRRSPAASTNWGAVQAIERLNLDGLLALWHPAERELSGGALRLLRRSAPSRRNRGRFLAALRRDP